MINVAICDDDSIIRKEVNTLCHNYLKSKNYSFNISEFSSGIELLDSNIDFTIIFLDINMPEIDGINVGKNIREYNKFCKIIYISNHTSYMKKSFNVRAFGFLEKPINKNEFYITLQEVIDYHQCIIKPIPYKFNTVSGMNKIDLNDILYFEYSERRVNIVMKDNVIYMYSSIKKLSKELDDYNFFSPHNAFLVNLKYIFNITSSDVVLHNHKNIPLSQKKRVLFKKRYAHYVNSTTLKNRGE